MSATNTGRKPASYGAQIAAAIAIGDKLNFTDEEKAKMLGLVPYTESVDALVERACQAQSLDIERRCAMMAEIDRRLQTHGADAMRVLREGRPYERYEKTFRELIVSGDYWNLHYVVLCIQTKT